MPEYIIKAADLVENLHWSARFGVLFLAVLCEYVLPIFPGDTFVLAAGFFKSHGGLGWFEILSAITLGSLTGIFLTVKLGCYLTKYKHKLNSKIKLKIISLDEIKKVSLWYEKYGLYLILFNRFFPGLRSFFFIAAGYLKLPSKFIFLLGLISALLFNILLVFFGHITGSNFEQIYQWWQNYTFVFFIVMALVLALFLGVFFYKKKKN